MKKTSNPVLQSVPDLHLDKNIQSFVRKTQNYADQTQRFFTETVNLTARLKTESNDEDPLSTRFIHSPRDKDAKNSYVFLKKKFTELNQVINLENRSLSQFPSNYYGYLPLNVRIVDLRNNKLKKFPEEVLVFRNLESLKLDNNSIPSLPENIFTEIHPRTFSIANNYLKAIPDEISNWASNIEYLNFSSNFIVSLPKVLSALSNLKSLHINNNSFMSLPCEMHKLSKLKELGLDWFKYVLPNVHTVINPTINSRAFSLFFTCLREKIKDEIFSLKDFFSFFSKKMALNPLRPLASHNGNHQITNTFVKPLEKIIFEAVLNEDLGILRYLIVENPNNWKVLDEEGVSPLTFAIQEEKYLSAKLLIQTGADVNFGGGKFGSAINLGLTKMQFYLIKDLLKYGANPNLPNIKGDYSLNFLFSEWCFENDETANKIFTLLMEHETQPNNRNDEGITPLHLAIMKKMKFPLKNIITYNNSKFNQEHSFDFSKKTKKQKQTCIHLAAGNEDFETLQLVFGQKETIGQVFEYDFGGCRPIHLARKSYSCIKLIRKYEIIFLNRFRFQAKRSLLTGDDIPHDISHENIGLDDEVESFSNNLVLKMKKINSINVKTSHFKSRILTRSLDKSPVRIKLEEANHQNLEDSNDSLRTDLEENNSASKGKRFEVKMLALSPNNIKKIERIQKYSHYFSRSQSERQAIPSSKNLGCLNANKKSKMPTFLITNLYKTLIYKFEKNKKKVQELRAEILSSGNILSDALGSLFKIFKIHYKMLNLAKELIEKNISLAIVNVNLFESSQITEEQLKQSQKQDSLQNFNIVYAELDKILKGFAGLRSYESKWIRYQIVASCALFGKEEIFDYFMGSEDLLVIFELFQCLKRKN